MFPRCLARTLVATTALAMVAAPVIGSTAAGAASTDDASRAGGGKPAPATLFGATAQQLPGESYGEAIDRADTKYGGMDTIRVFYPGLPASWTQIDAMAGSRPLVLSFKADPVAVAAGQHDAFFASWFASAPSDRRTFWTYWHEPEDDIERGAFTAAQYRAAWTRLAALAKEHAPWRMRATLILMCWTLERGSGRDWHDYHVPGAIRAMGWDCYNAGYRNGFYRTPENLFANVLAVHEETGLPFGISELGSVLATGDGDGDERAAWLDKVSSYLRAHRARFVTYFDSNIGVEFRLLDAPSAGAWRRSVSS